MDDPPTDFQWRSWYAEHGPKFWLFARQKARSDVEAQDLMQEAILEAARRSRDSGPPAAALVFATIHRRAIDAGRRDDRRAARESAAGESHSQVWFDTSAEERERAGLIEDALMKLPEIYREVITLKVWGGLTFLEISEAVSIPASTAASRYRYGLEQLRRLMKEVLT